MPDRFEDSRRPGAPYLARFLRDVGYHRSSPLTFSQLRFFPQLNRGFWHFFADAMKSVPFLRFKWPETAYRTNARKVWSCTKARASATRQTIQLFHFSGVIRLTVTTASDWGTESSSEPSRGAIPRARLLRDLHEWPVTLE